MKKILAATLLSLAALGASAEIALHEDGRSLASTAVATKTAQFRPSPIPPDWVMAGNPTAESFEVSRTRDDGAQVFLWRTTAGTFHWTHSADEIVTILRGEVFVTDGDGTRHHLTAGDVAHFPEGAVQTWEVPEELLKSVILKHRSPMTVEAPLRWIRQVRAMVAG